MKKAKYRASFLWREMSGPVEEAGYEFVNAQTEAYRRLWWKHLIKRVEARLMKKPNDLLRSAFQIAERKGADTNWESFTNSLRVELEREHKIMYPRK